MDNLSLWDTGSRKEEFIVPRTRPAYPPKFRRQIVELVRAGRSPEELAKEFEPSAQTIRTWANQASRSWITDAFIRTSARSIESISGANSSIFLARDRPFVDRRSGVAGPGAERYLRTVLRSSPVSLAISDRLIAPDSNRPQKHRSSNQRCGSKTTVDRPSATYTDQAAECRAASLSASGTGRVHPYAGGDVQMYADISRKESDHLDAMDLADILRTDAPPIADSRPAPSLPGPSWSSPAHGRTPCGTAPRPPRSHQDLRQERGSSGPPGQESAAGRRRLRMLGCPYHCLTHRVRSSEACAFPAPSHIQLADPT
ncbi:hypothetical protein GCM10010121_075020 [Streptomyces brasiliensis]|uniref:Transposase n=1 Tax=Streptomyces brasiliensis TaxID=1954 RepID=A0A917L940_9ACTN|nr:hypothetical protein GCM10010121_075020 [Streptomyces brasiliensis]